MLFTHWVPLSPPSCSDSCCSRHCGCCFNFASAYWYAWFLIVVFFFICLCACIGCGGYGYRRYYVVQRYPTATSGTTVVTQYSATPPAAGGYQPFTNEQYKPYQPQAHPPAYTADPAPPAYTKPAY